MAALGGLGALVHYGKTEGDIRRLFRGYNFTGHLCGVDVPDKPYLYWCQKNSSLSGAVMLNAIPHLDLLHPICVQKCPTSASTTHVCFREAEKVPTHVPKASDDDQLGSFYLEEVTRYIFAVAPDYESTTFLDRYCLPKDQHMMAELMQALNKHHMTRLLLDVSQISTLWTPLIVAVVVAVLLGYVYIFLLEHFAKLLVNLAIIFIVIVGVCVGSYLVISQWTGGIDGIPNNGDSKWNMWAGIALFLVAAAFGVFACCAHESIEVAAGCVESAAECALEMPSLFLEPLLSMTLKIILFILLAYGFLLLASVGKVRHMTLDQFVSRYEVPGMPKVGGVFRTFQYHEQQQWYFAFYIVVSVWILSITTALSQFVISYSVQLWYFTPCDPNGKKVGVHRCPIWRGYFVGIFYHLGSLAFGAFLVTVLFIARVVLGALSRVAHHEGNQFLACVLACISVCLKCYESFLEFVNKNAYMDIAINSTPFCTAVENALHMFMSQGVTIAFLNGACWVLTIAGNALITCTGTFVIWTMVRGLWRFNNVESDEYVHDPVLVSAIAGVICLLVSVCFMVVFDTIADTILYCYATEGDRKDKGTQPKEVFYAPEGLRTLMNEHSHLEHTDSERTNEKHSG